MAVSIISKTSYEPGTTLFIFVGLSTDTKPVGDHVQNGSMFIEMNTHTVYLYDADGAAGEEWRAWK